MKYWNEEGKYQEEYKELARLIPLAGPCDDRRGEILRAGAKLYYRHFNDGDTSDECPKEVAFLTRIGVQAECLITDEDFDRLMDEVMEKIIGMGITPNIYDYQND